jgi:hypothetical protein
MAEGLVERIIGSEEEKPELEAPEALSGAEAGLKYANQLGRIGKSRSKPGATSS